MYLFILATPGLSCGMWDLHYSMFSCGMCSCGMQDLLVAACGLLSCSIHVGSSSLTRDRTQAPLHWEHGVILTSATKWRK